MIKVPLEPTPYQYLLTKSNNFRRAISQIIFYKANKYFSPNCLCCLTAINLLFSNASIKVLLVTYYYHNVTKQEECHILQ